jgi:phytoene dehydrogenase-like protein
VLIVGAGLAGLACAGRLHQAGARPLIFEGSDDVGGRVRTDVVDGFLLDRGFQVFLDAYPVAGSLLDLNDLDLRRFKAGALIYQAAGMQRVMDVFREPRYFVRSALAPVGSLADKLRVGILRWRLLHRSISDIAQREDLSTEVYLQRAGFSRQIIDGFFRSFYGGIFLERELRTSSRMFEFTFKMFAQGSATLPARGMGEIPRQLVSRLPPGTIRCDSRVTEITKDSITLASGERVQGEAVVIATDASAAASLTEGEGAAAPVWRSVTCLYFAAPRSPLGESIIALNGSGSGLVNNVCVPSDLSTDYAPPGQALVSVSVLGSLETEALEAKVQTELAGWFGNEVHDWRHLKTYQIERALPAQEPSGRPVGPGYRMASGCYVCGDHLWSASIEGAMISGTRTADAILKS